MEPGQGTPSQHDDVYPHLKVYTEVLERIKLEYVEEPDMKNVTLGAIDGLLESVDPFASYLSADQYRQYENLKNADSVGVGLVLAKRYGYVAVVDSIPGSPADKAGISSGDLIDSINGVATRDMPLAYAEQLLRGAPELDGRAFGAEAEKPRAAENHADPRRCEIASGYREAPAGKRRLSSDREPGRRRGRKRRRAKLKDLENQGAKYVVLDLRHCATGDDAKGSNLRICSSIAATSPL